MKIAVVAPGSLPIPAIKGGAIETLVTHLINKNECSGSIDIDVYTCIPPECENQIPGYKHTRVIPIKIKPWKQKIYTFYARLLRLLCFKKIQVKQYSAIKSGFAIKKSNVEYDYIIIEGNHYQVLQIAKVVKIPIILHMHTDILTKDTPNGKKICQTCYKILVISEFLKQRIAEIAPEDSHKIIVYKNAISLEDFGCDKYAEFRQNFRNKYHIAEKEFLFIFCGRIDESKGVREIIKAFIGINKPCKLLIVGSSWFDTNKETPYIKELKELSSVCKDKIIFSGYVKYEKIPQYYYSADVGVFPSICNEAAGLVVIEALASGIPVITTNMGGIPEYADTRSCSILACDSYLVENLRDSMIKIIDNEEYYNRKKQTAKASVKQYNTDNYYSEFLRIIGEE